MGIGTKNLDRSTQKRNSFTTKREAIKELRKKHEPLFVKEGLTLDAKFLPRNRYKHEGELVIGFYPSEIIANVDIYTEFWSRDWDPEDPNRTLWKWMYNAEYETEYKKSEPHPTSGHRMYYIPTDELIDVEELHTPKPEGSLPIIKEEVITEVVDSIKTDIIETPKEPVEEFLDDTPLAGEDVPYSAMTLRDHVAITYKKPLSNKAWLNNLITKTFP